MTGTTPTITVLMPAYNAEKYIGEAIASVLQQTFTDFELLIVNDGSTDRTINIIKTFDDPRIRLINQPNLGVAAALNNGLKEAKTNYIARFDADDICLPERLQRQYYFLLNNPEYIIVGSKADYIDMNSEYVFSYSPPAYNNEEIQQLEILQCAFIHSTVLFKKQTVIDAGGYNVHAHNFEDHLLWSTILKEGKAYNLPQVLLKVRLNPQSVTIDETWRSKRFRKIKYSAITKGNITKEEGKELQTILKQQNNRQIKEGSYYALLAKKYLWDNHQPRKARINLRKTLSLKPLSLQSYSLLLLSYMPGKMIQKLYSWMGPVK
jgi:glycosyltransferase involved in cell wall biosynthesis